MNPAALTDYMVGKGVLEMAKKSVGKQIFIRGIRMFDRLHSENGIYQNLIGGAWRASHRGKTIAITSPLDGHIVGKVPSMSMEEADEVIKIAREAQKSWRKVPANRRSEILLRPYRIPSRLVRRSGHMACQACFCWL